MKKFFLSMAAACLMPFLLHAQHSISGIVMDKKSSTTLPRAHVAVKNTHIVVFSDASGHFEIRQLPKGTYKIKCTYVGYKPYIKVIEVREDKTIEINMQQTSTLADEVIISATRSTDFNPVTQTIITREEIGAVNMGQDLPFLLKMTPSTTITSDAGMGIGYTGINIRGSDATRINVTINGIPVNDSESHGVWWVNMPDFASSVENIQVQRGVGTSTHGAAAFGASINLQTNTLNEKRYAEVASAVGSFNSMKNTISFGTGLLPSKWAIDGRMSRIVSDGYIDRASSDLSSYYLSAGYYGQNSILKLIHFSGSETTYQAWYGVPGDSLKTNRTYNPAGRYYDNDGNIRYYDNETDNYRQDHYQVHFSHQLTPMLTVNAAGHYTYGRGYYEQYRPNDRLSRYELSPMVIGADTIMRTDLIRRRWLDNHFYGLTYALNYNNLANFDAVIGGAFNKYDGDHFGEIIWAEFAKGIEPNHRYYDNKGVKTDFNNFIKINYQTGAFSLFGDLQHRRISYDFVGKALVNNEIENLDQNVVFNFINPKAGITYNLNPQNSIYAFWGIANREPVRRDFTESSPESRPKHETMNNFELGFRRNERNYFMAVNAYLMNYKNQLVLTGKINDVGDYTRTNIDESYRAGIEVESHIRLTSNVKWGLNFTYSRNTIIEHTEYYDVYDENWNWEGVKSIDYTHTPIAFSPDFIAGSILSYRPFNNFEIDIYSKYIGSQYIDNTADKDRRLDAYLVNDVRLSYTRALKLFEQLQISLMLNNILDEQYITNAWVYNGIFGNGKPIALDDGYFPQAGRHYLLGVNIRF